MKIRKAIGGDIALASVMLVVQLLGAKAMSVPVYLYVLDTGGSPPIRLEPTPVDALGYALLAVVSLGMVARSAWPVATLVLTSGIFAVYMWRAYSVGPIVLTVALCLFTVVLAGRRWQALTALAFVVAATTIWIPRIEAAHGELSSFVWTVVAFFSTVLAIFGTPVLVGEILRNRREAADRRIVQAERAAEHRLTEQRLDFAREVHDVVAHTMAGIAVQAAAALRLLDDPPPEVRTALVDIRTASREALHDLKETVGSMRCAPQSASKGLDHLEALVTAVRKAGVPVTLEREGAPRPLPARVDHVAYRVVQESLTNVLRHAGHGAGAGVRLEYGPSELLVHVTDDGTGGDGTGHGLAGMRERVEALGGTTRAGNRPGGGFEVAARLPLGDA
ncbi:sensor histidine kinase [Spirillospora sp. CA-294931]|uniref:sensor histidine kinase n=1 Tax=Spirillospora sp. CA-294931 TaxID=3240042 RepID=UPI003D94C296